MSEQKRAGYELRAPESGGKWLLIRLDWGSPIRRYDSYEDAFHFWHEELRQARREEVVLNRMLAACRKCAKMRDACEEWVRQQGRAALPAPFDSVKLELWHDEVSYSPKIVPRLAARAYRDDEGSVFSDLLSGMRDLEAEQIGAATPIAGNSSSARRL